MNIFFIYKTYFLYYLPCILDDSERDGIYCRNLTYSVSENIDFINLI